MQRRAPVNNRRGLPMKHFHDFIATPAVFFLCAFWTTTAELVAQTATLSTETLTARSDVVAIGTVADLQSAWASNKTRIVTRVTIAVREFLKGGNGEQQLTIVTPGGEIGDVGELYCGVARFQRDEEVVVFARNTTGKEMQVAGGALGKLTLNREANVMMAAPGVTLDHLRSQVRSAVQAPSPEEK
jgi:hypothetical protein